jgi:intracellular sulfur oxidation DsrE/DsrF family protein
MSRLGRFFGLCMIASGATLTTTLPITLSTLHCVSAQERDQPAQPRSQTTPPQLEFPIIRGHGGVVRRPQAAEPPRAGARVVFDTTADAQPGDVNKGLDRVARLLNLYGVAGLQAQDVKITLVLHGEATKTALNDAAYQARFEVPQNPNLTLIRELQQAGVEVLVCGQALNYKGFADATVASNIPIAVAALTVVINKQSDGYAYIPVP